MNGNDRKILSIAPGCPAIHTCGSFPGSLCLRLPKTRPIATFEKKFGVEKWKQPKILHIPVMRADGTLWSFVHGDIDR
jgi:hypothetical protein